MTDPEINEAVARKMGNVRWTSGATGFKTIDDLTTDEKDAMIPDYCHSIAAAWEIVEKIPWFSLHSEHDHWKIIFTKGISRRTLKADTAPMAICLAFLNLRS